MVVRLCLACVSVSASVSVCVHVPVRVCVYVCVRVCVCVWPADNDNLIIIFILKIV